MKTVDSEKTVGRFVFSKMILGQMHPEKYLLHLNQLKLHLSGPQHLRFPAMAGKDNDLVAVSGGEPFQRRLQALIVVLCKAVVEDQRETAGAGTGEKLRGGETQGQVDLIHGSAADILEGNQLCLRV